MKKKNKIIVNRSVIQPYAVLLLAIIFLLVSDILTAQVSGVVYRDLPFNGASSGVYGVKTTNELGVEGVMVTVYPGGLTATTASDGTWSIAAPPGDVRIEYSNWPSYLEESADGGVANSSIQFATSPVSNLTFGLHNPADYTEPSPRLATAHFISGASSAGGLNNSIVSFGYTQSGAPGLPIEASKNQVGSVWGLAFSKKTQTLYSSAFLKRHVGLGPNGLGAIYATSFGVGANGSLFVNIPNVGTINEAGRGLGAFNAPSFDADAFGLVGKIGLGDIDISEDEETLYVVNLNDRNIYVIDIATASITGNYAIPNPNCTNGEFRPFALTYKDGVVYVGGVCDASSGASADMRAYVYTFDPVALSFSTTPILDFALDYTRGGSILSNPDVGAAGESLLAHSDNWYPWEDTYAAAAFNETYIPGDPRTIVLHSQPILSDIEILEGGKMILNFIDRTGHQIGEGNYLPASAVFTGAFAAGDVLLATYTANTWTIEPHVTSGAIEYFHRDNFSGHGETSSGGSAIVAGSNQLFTTAMDPLSLNSGGVIKLNTTTGNQPSQGLQVFLGNLSNGVFAKATGMGDIEVLSEPAPVEIGNLVWADQNSNGIQDAGEAGIANVQIQLLKLDGTPVGVATTDNNGNYIFSSAAGSNTSSHIYGLSMLMPEQSYIIRIPNASGASQQAAITGAKSPANTGEGTDTTLNDSDGITNGTSIERVVQATEISRFGANNHSFDFGFSSCPAIRCGTVIIVEN